MKTASKSIPNAPDLTKQPARSPRLRLGGFVIMARMIDKGRATINGTAGEYHFNCPLDNMLFGFKGVDGEDVRQVLESGASDAEVAAWITDHGERKSPAEIKTWSDATERASPHGDPEKREWFDAECARLGLDPAKSTLFDYLDADDRASFRAT